MSKLVDLPFVDQLQDSLKRQPQFIHVVLGPRQVGKTTGVQQLLKSMKPKTYLYSSADGQVARGAQWLEHQWLSLSATAPSGLLVIDEIQKVENWSEVIKKLWDRQKTKTSKLRVILLGSSSLALQNGLSESLTGRFQLHKVHQWNFAESHSGYRLNFEDYLRFGGYPGSYALIDRPIEWLSYMRESIVDTVIGRDILQLARVKSPSLFRQSFDLACAYGGQEISYTKLLGQLQDRGNVDLVKHYLELFEAAFLLKQVFKYSNKPTLRRSSSPKILPLCPALFSITKDADLDTAARGRAFEIAVGGALARRPGHLYYWRERGDEVDYVYTFGRKVFAFEVKSGDSRSKKGLSKFLDKFPNAEAILVTEDNFTEVLSGLP